MFTERTKEDRARLLKQTLAERGIPAHGMRKAIMEHMEKLLEKVGNTTINQTNNIQLNSYGKEDLSHITDNLKNDLLKIPYFFWQRIAIPK